MSSTSRRTRAPRGQGQLLRAELIGAAEDLLRELGSPDRVRIADIVERVGVSAPALYAHFADKDALFNEIQAIRFAEFRDILRAATGRTRDPMKQLRLRGRAYIRYVIEHPEQYRTLFMTEKALAARVLHDPLAREMSAYDDLVGNVQALIDTGRFRARTDAELVARVIWSGVHGIASLAITVDDFTEPFELDALVEELLSMIEAGLLARHGTR